jgi:N6-adenosine-specific RNA methylase IME4
MKYSLIYADPAWEYGNTVSNGAATNHYGTMKLIDMKRLPVWDLAADDAVLAMWFTGTHTREAIELAEAWGFKVRTMKGFTWVKFNPLAEQHINKALQAGGVEDFYDFLDLLNEQTRMNGGNYTRANTEDMLIATRGNGLERQCASIKQVIYSPLGSTARSQQRRVSVWRSFTVTFRASNCSAAAVRQAGTTGVIRPSQQLI